MFREESKQDSDMDEPWIMTVKGPHGVKGSVVPMLPLDEQPTSLTLTHTNHRSSNHNQASKPHANGASRSPPKDSTLNHYRSDSSRDSLRDGQAKPVCYRFSNHVVVVVTFLVRASLSCSLVSSQSRPHEAAPPPPVDTREKRDDRDYRDSSRESTLREPKEMRDGRERDRDVRERERDRESRDRERGRDFNSREKRRNSKPEVPVAPMVDHRSSEDKQRPRSSQELKHPRSVALSGVVLPLLSEVL